MTFHKCSIRGEKYGEKAVEDPPMEQEVATGKISRPTSPQDGTDPAPTVRCPAGTTSVFYIVSGLVVHVHIYMVMKNNAKYTCTCTVHNQIPRQD